MLITRRIHINPKYLNGDIHKSLLMELQEQTKKECTSEHGYILDVEEITRILDGFNVSAINCDVICDIEFRAKTLKPKMDEEYEGTVCVIMPKVGVLLEVNDCLKVLVKFDSLREYTYENIDNSYTHNKLPKKITVGDTIKVKLQGVKYTDHKFSCFGNLVEI